VIPDHEPIVLDPEILLELFRGKEFGQWLDATYRLRERPNRPIVSIVTVGEILAIAERRGYGAERRDRLEELLADVVVVDVTRPIAEWFALILAETQRIGKPIGEDDTWISATTAALEATLIAKDTDFDKIPPGLIKLEKVVAPGRP
jgi:predicted nucleic acid-binding protein